jgi:hypothetical protein
MSSGFDGIITASISHRQEQDKQQKISPSSSLLPHFPAFKFEKTESKELIGCHCGKRNGN